MIDYRAMEILPGILARRVGANRAAATLQRQRRLPRSEVDNLVDLYATGHLRPGTARTLGTR